MDPELKAKIAEMDAKIDALSASAEQTTRYIRYIFISAAVGVALTILPLIGLMFAAPAFINSYTTQLDGI